MSKNILNKKYNFLRPIKTKSLVRMGRNMVGGYIVDLEIIEKTNTLISLGFGPEWSFEDEFLKIKDNGKIIIYDHGLTTVPYLREILKYLRRLIMLRGSLKSLIDRFKNYKDYKDFFNQKKVKHYNEKITYPSTTKNCADLSKVVSRQDEDSEIILKIDIQSNEYKIINQIIEHSNKINLLIMQFYWIDKNEKIFEESIKNLKTKYEIIHIHANNHHNTLENGLPKMLEITFFNKKFSPKNLEYNSEFPIKELDFSSHPGKKDISFVFQK